MFTKFKDYFKKSPEPELTETQKEIDKNLYDSVKDQDYWKFLDAIKKGGNPNQDNYSEEEISQSPYHTIYTLLMTAINWSNWKMVDELIENGADVYHQVDDDFDVFDWANKTTQLRDRPKIKQVFLKYHPDFFEEREMRKNANKYNL